ncbi:MAG: type II toxin-antitoxin system RelB/DinJ family antitoxin [Defluviitaleaceae bacterium]|nr:type II toxin-antitoxin system RelB/DinJ family antitoxin [Defluviitaleaceae bacterium]
METTTQITIDSELKKSADSLFAPLGLDTGAVVRVLLKHLCETKSVPPVVTEYAKKSEEELEAIRQARLSVKGSMKIWMADDFDAPLEEFEEYM